MSLRAGLAVPRAARAISCGLTAASAGSACQSATAPRRWQSAPPAGGQHNTSYERRGCFNLSKHSWSHETRRRHTDARPPACQVPLTRKARIATSTRCSTLKPPGAAARCNWAGQAAVWGCCRCSLVCHGTWNGVASPSTRNRSRPGPESPLPRCLPQHCGTAGAPPPAAPTCCCCAPPLRAPPPAADRSSSISSRLRISALSSCGPRGGDKARWVQAEGRVARCQPWQAFPSARCGKPSKRADTTLAQKPQPLALADCSLTRQQPKWTVKACAAVRSLWQCHHALCPAPAEPPAAPQRSRAAPCLCCAQLVAQRRAGSGRASCVAVAQRGGRRRLFHPLGHRRRRFWRPYQHHP